MDIINLLNYIGAYFLIFGGLSSLIGLEYANYKKDKKNGILESKN